MRYHFTPIKIAIIKKTKQTNKKQTQKVTSMDKDVKKVEPIAGRNVKWCNRCKKWYGDFSKKKKELQYDPAIPLLGIYPEKQELLTDICMPVFIVALFTIAERWQQLKCPLTDE